MSTVAELLDMLLEREGGAGSPRRWDSTQTVELDGLPERVLYLVDNGRGDCIIGAARRPGADTDNPAHVAAQTLREVKSYLDLAHRCLHSDDVAGAHRALHAARNPAVPWPS